MNSACRIFILSMFGILLQMACSCDGKRSSIETPEDDPSVFWVLKHEHSFVTSDRDTNMLGYKSFIDDQDLSITSISAKGDTVYLADRLFDLIRAIDVKTGKMISRSKSLSQASGNRMLLKDLFLLGDLLVVTTDRDRIFVLDATNLVLLRTIMAPQGEKRIWSYTDDLLVIVSETKKVSENEFSLSLLSIDNEGIQKTWEEILDEQAFKSFINAPLCTRKSGDLDRFTFEPKGYAPTEIIEFDACNYYFNDRTFVCYSVNEGSLNLYHFAR